MTGPLKIAFYAPMKAPDHPVPSGDRQMARLLIAALRLAGHDVDIISALRSHCPAPDPARWTELQAQARREGDGIATRWRSAGPPDLWFTYHNYYKAPDLLGPPLTRAYGLPYAIAEASHARHRAEGWGAWATLADAATRQADLHVCFTHRDRAGLAGLLEPDTIVVDLPPFIDERTWPGPITPRPTSGPPTILTVAMMRPGDKLRSYGFLGEALERLGHLDWRIRLVGDGPARGQVAAAFARIPPDRVTFCGELEAPEIAREMARADLLAWPGFGEAFGLAYLEAQFSGLPVAALDTAGVGSVVRQDETGLLVGAPDPQVYATALARLIADEDLRRRTGAAAARWVGAERTIASASRTLNAVLHRTVKPEGRIRAG